MHLSRHQTAEGPRWAVNGQFVDGLSSLGELLSMPGNDLTEFLSDLSRGDAATGSLLAPIDPDQEVWASGVTYLRSREARQAESDVGDVYQRVYDAPRPELFFKSLGWRAVGHEEEVRLRADSRWNVPEPELAIVINREGDIVAYTAGNDMSSRDIEGENPLYLPQAKTFNGSCALGPGIELAPADALVALPIRAVIRRGDGVVFEGETSIEKMKRKLPELVGYLRRELDFPRGVVLFTGTGIVPPDEFTLNPGDVIEITVGTQTLRNRVAR